MKITGIKKAVGEHNNWLNRSPFYRANIMLDTSTGEVWCDCFTQVATSGKSTTIAQSFPYPDTCLTRVSGKQT